MLPTPPGPQPLRLGRPPLPEQAERFPVARVELAAVHRQPGRGTAPMAARRSISSATPPAPTGWDWRGSPNTHSIPPGQPPPPPTRCELPGSGSGRSHPPPPPCPAPTRPLGQVDGQLGDGAGLQAGLGQPRHRLGRGRHPQHRAAPQPRRGGSGVSHGRLAVTGRGQHHPQRPARHPSTSGPPSPGRRPTGHQPANADSTDSRGDPGGRAGSQASINPTISSSNCPVGGGRPLRRPPPAPLVGRGQPHRPDRRPRTGRPGRRSPRRSTGPRTGRRGARPRRLR